MPRGGYISFHCQPGQKRPHLRSAHVHRMAQVVEADEEPYPITIGFFGTPAVVKGTENSPHLIQIYIRYQGILVKYPSAISRNAKEWLA